ncbi:MAG TPA: glycine oxidase ThiO [Acidobacteriota bacterium]|jgi:glycine oxidase|nr:glycine oxidase ThiO [Acidobacteriota bacterium]
MPSFDIAVVGGGIIGCSLALELAMRGKRVCLLEQNECCQEASWAAAGMLVPQSETEEADILFDWLCASRDMYPQWCQQIHRLSGTDPGFQRSGTLSLIAADLESQRRADQIFRWQSERGLPVEKMSASRIRQLEPSLRFHHAGALYFPEDHHVDNRALARSLVRACEQAGVSIFCHHPAHGITVESHVSVSAGTEVFKAAQAVIATGAWSQRWQETFRCIIPVFPAKGEIIALKDFPLASGHIVQGEGIYLVPRDRDFTLVGSTVDFGNFNKDPSAGGIAWLLDRALKLFPEGSRAKIVSAWGGLRPCTPDQLPVLGPIPAFPQVWVATGHYRNGILLAPITGRCVADRMLGRPSSLSMEAFSLERFQHDHERQSVRRV